jgi:transposase-like protein
MAAVNRNEPKRGSASESTYSLMEFMRECPDDAACLDMLWRERFAPDGHHAYCPKCERERKFHRVRSRPNYACDSCGYHLRPLAGTIFHKSPTSLHLWFYAMYLMASTRCGVSAKHLERELGVTYKTAWRMFNLIRNKLMADDDEPLSGDVEIDETTWGGKPKRPHGESKYVPAPGARARGIAHAKQKPVVLGMVERGGRVRARVISTRHGAPLSRAVVENVNPDSIIFTDDWLSYKPLRRHYIDHKVINHSAGLYVQGDTHTNTIEGFFGNLKTGMRGNYKKVSLRWLQGYLNEYTWRYNHRRYDGRSTFHKLVERAATTTA